ncbi:MAG: acyl carrier protein [Geminicoccaceae bacterium]|nr:acyl carrier protein [Geminicoccaceae bacterium]MCB2013073.1 acyl carrier protein [Geminicoccaceae bacterium]
MTDSLRRHVLELLDRYNPERRTVEDTTELAAGLNIDSVAAMDLIMEIEDHFEIDIPMNQVSELQTVGDLVGLVRTTVDTKGQ